jgi:AAA+ superfamily predicted ATPase
MRRIKLFEEYTNKKKTILILGLPGSGKSYLAKKIQMENPNMDYKIYDDNQIRKALENSGMENQIISDGPIMFDYRLYTDIPYSTIKKIKDSGAELEIMYFENDPEKAFSNVIRRNKSGESTPFQRLISKYDILQISDKYKRIIPSDAKIIPIWTGN